MYFQMRKELFGEPSTSREGEREKKGSPTNSMGGSIKVLR